MKEIPLTQGRFALVDDEDFEYLNQWKWQVYREKNRKTEYAQRTARDEKGRRKNIRMHRAIMPTCQDIDHADGNGLNNQKANLRPCSMTQNLGNTSLRRDSTSGYKGVSKMKDCDRWRAQIQYKKKKKHLGLYSTKEEAQAVYRRAAKECFGEFCNTSSL